MRVEAWINDRFPSLYAKPAGVSANPVDVHDLPDKLAKELMAAHERLERAEQAVAHALGWDQSYWQWRDAG